MRSSLSEETRRVPPQRPPPPNFGSSAVHVLSGDDPQHAIVVESPACPDRSPSTTPVDTPTKRRAPPPPPVSPSKVRCESSVYIPLEDHIYALPECTNNDPGDDPRLGMIPAPERQRRPAPSPPRSNQPTEREGNHQRQRNHQSQRRPAPSPPLSRSHQRTVTIRTGLRASPYLPPAQQLDQPPRRQQPTSSGNNTFPRTAKILFQDVIPTLPRPNLLLAEPPSQRRTPSIDVMQELYQHSRHPLDLRTHLTIASSWAKKAEEKHGECIICYQEDRHLQIKCRNCKGMKVCCTCVVGIYQS